MRLDPQTPVANLLLAIPSSALAFHRLGILAQGNENKTLQELCTDGGISVEDFLRAMHEIDWSKESPAIEDADRS